MDRYYVSLFQSASGDRAPRMVDTESSLILCRFLSRDGMRICSRITPLALTPSSGHFTRENVHYGKITSGLPYERRRSSDAHTENDQVKFRGTGWAEFDPACLTSRRRVNRYSESLDQLSKTVSRFATGQSFF